MIYNLEELINAHNAGKKLRYLFFWGHTPKSKEQIDASCLSQWWMCSFEVEGVVYNCAEQYMMAEKARLFGDEEMLGKIMEAKHPKEMKAYGRAVKNFDNIIWENSCTEIVRKANYAKFSQNQELWEYLRTTGKRILVEASPRDRIWGIGLGKTNPDAENPMKWRGKNLLGFALTQMRDELLKEGAVS